MNQQLLRRAWDALDSFKQAYPENWHEDDEQVMMDLMRADMKLSGVQPKWVGLTEAQCGVLWKTNMTPFEYYQAIEAKLKEKNT